VFTHDSVFLGEDGPTHQPVEHVPSLRLIPNLDVWRPADGLETAVAWACALERRDGPSALVLTRQKTAALDRAEGFDRAVIRAGGYVLAEAKGGRHRVILIATGSEVGLAVAARSLLLPKGIDARVVSMPCVERFEAQPEPYRRSVLPKGARLVTIEAARSLAWAQVAGLDSLRIGIDRFGASAPAEVIAKELGLTPESVAERVVGWLS
jgi:transketolase